MKSNLRLFKSGVVKYYLKKKSPSCTFYTTLKDTAYSESGDISKPFTFSYDCLPEETMYILDGTSWLFNAYFR